MTDTFKLAERQFETAVEHFRDVVKALRDGKISPQAANAALNEVIAVGFRYKEAAVEPPPLPMPPRKTTRKEVKI